MCISATARSLTAACFVSALAAQQLARDVHQAPYTGMLSYGSLSVGTSDGARAYFDGWSQDSGTELWVSDGTAAGTRMLRDLVPGAANGFPEPVQWVGNRLLFSTRTFGLQRDHLWVTDGTPAGTVPMTDRVSSGGQLRGLGVLQGRAIFGCTGLWASDLTDAGTTSLANCNVLGTFVQGAQIGNRIVFSGSVDPSGAEPWVTDGTSAGTYMLADVHPSWSSMPDGFTVLGAHVYFLAVGAASTVELWRTDGTPGGTQQVLVTPFARTINQTERMVRAGGALLVLLGGNLWRSDGTAAGTTMLLPAGADTTRELVSDGTIAYAVHGSQLWRSDGSVAGTSMVADLGAVLASPRTLAYGSFVEQGQARLVSSQYGIVSTVVYSDGTAAGTTTADIPGITPPRILRAGNRLVLLTRGMTNSLPPVLMVSDGTQAGTGTLATQTGISGNTRGKCVTMNGVLYTFLNDGVHGLELWRSDGTAAGTSLVADVFPGPDYSISAYTELVVMDDHLYFTATTPATGMALWRSDGTPAGTTVLYDAYGAVSGAPAQLVVDDHTLYFTDFDPTNSFGTVLRSDGTPGGTVAVPGLHSAPVPFGVLHGVVIHGVAAQGLWRTDGTPAGTYALPAPTPRGIARLGDRLVFFGEAPGFPLFATDGTVAGTQQLLASVPAGPEGGALRPWRNGLARLAGAELLTTDGTPAGSSVTQLPLPDAPTSVAFAADTLYMVVADAAHGAELWRSDGTAAGTFRVTDLAPGFQNGVAEVFATPLGDRVLLAASNGLDGLEPYVSDGTAAGTVRLADLNPQGSSNPQYLGVAGERIFYLANDGTTGDEPGSLFLAQIDSPAVESLGVGCAGASGLPELAASAPRLGSTFTSTLHHAVSFAPSVFAFAVGRDHVVLPSGCVLHVGSGAATVFTLTSGLGSASVGLALPNDPAFTGLVLCVQALVLDPAGAALPGLATSQGVFAVVGR